MDGVLLGHAFKDKQVFDVELRVFVPSDSQTFVVPVEIQKIEHFFIVDLKE